MIGDRKSSWNPWRRKFLKAGVGGGMALMAGLLNAFSSSSAQTDSTGLAESKEKITDASRLTSPEWTKDLIIYELGTTQGFTSPNGPGTGTFKSLTGKFPYMQDLGITGIWMDPPSLQDQHRFYYNMWCRYAVVAPEKFDPVLGTESDFKTMIEEAHRHGIRIFLDIKTHGAMDYSPLVKDHPTWFRGKHWEMSDYDWFGGHTDLDDWWVKIWSDCVSKYKVDGFRLDVDLFRPDLWARIRENASRAGHPIIIFEEQNSAIPGVTDFNQRDSVIMDDSGVLNEVMLHDMPGFYDRRYGRTGNYKVVITFSDGSRAKGSTDGQGTIKVHFDGLSSDKTARRRNERSWYVQAVPDGIPDVRLTVDNVEKRAIQNIVVHDDMSGQWKLNGDGSPSLALEGEAPSLKLYLATIAHGWPEIQLSCHDQGWDGFPLDKNPYTAQGSRSIFGYSCLFGPAIPVFFSGEEFDATFRPLPWQSPYIFGGKDPGKGTWLYGCMLDWEELKNPEHRAMFEDVKKMIAIRKRESKILTVTPEVERPNLMAIPVEGEGKAPVPYIRWNESGAILVAGNLDTNQDIEIKLRIPLEAIGMGRRGSYNVTELWPGGESKAYGESDLASFPCTVKRDKTARGGLLVLKIEPVK